MRSAAAFTHQSRTRSGISDALVVGLGTSDPIPVPMLPPSLVGVSGNGNSNENREEVSQLHGGDEKDDKTACTSAASSSTTASATTVVLTSKSIQPRRDLAQISKRVDLDGGTVEAGSAACQAADGLAQGLNLNVPVGNQSVSSLPVGGVEVDEHLHPGFGKEVALGLDSLEMVMDCAADSGGGGFFSGNEDDNNSNNVFEELLSPHSRQQRRKKAADDDAAIRFAAVRSHTGIYGMIPEDGEDDELELDEEICDSFLGERESWRLPKLHARSVAAEVELEVAPGKALSSASSSSSSSHKRAVSSTSIGEQAHMKEPKRRRTTTSNAAIDDGGHVHPDAIPQDQSDLGGGAAKCKLLTSSVREFVSSTAAERQWWRTSALFQQEVIPQSKRTCVEYLAAAVGEFEGMPAPGFCSGLSQANLIHLHIESVNALHIWKKVRQAMASDKVYGAYGTEKATMDKVERALVKISDQIRSRKNRCVSSCASSSGAGACSSGTLGDSQSSAANEQHSLGSKEAARAAPSRKDKRTSKKDRRVKKAAWK
ncbi:unnamed protein product [Amoebophrya sp. A25]|nr:unnamed protein product [Amoebophrya sp. A25]|eukprot:GSA25T00026692001.1